MRSKKICVVGLGYIGLPTALLFAKAGHDVVGLDVDGFKISSLNNKTLYFEEEGLSELFEPLYDNGAIAFTTETPKADVYIIAVPTPTDRGKADLKYVLAALETIRPRLTADSVVILESTVGPRDCVDIIWPLLRSYKKTNKFALCTERAIPGSTLVEMVENDRVIGADDDQTGKQVVELYGSFVKGQICQTGLTTAAVCKVMENTYRSVNIALANECAKLSAELDFNVWEAIDLANQHPRVNIHSPGPGVGGHCIPVDPYFLVSKNKTNSIIGRSLQVNESMPEYVSEQISSLVSGRHSNVKTICLLGCSYKKNVDDMRESPTFVVKKFLETAGFLVVLSDPFVAGKEIETTKSGLQRSDAVAVIVDHDQYRNIDFSEYENIDFVYDTRNCVSSEQKKQTVVYSLGIPIKK